MLCLVNTPGLELVVLLNQLVADLHTTYLRQNQDLSLRKWKWFQQSSQLCVSLTALSLSSPYPLLRRVATSRILEIGVSLFDSLNIMLEQGQSSPLLHHSTVSARNSSFARLIK
jgi:hypothetical protein